MKSLAAAFCIMIPLGLAIQSHYRWKAQEQYGQLLLESMDRIGEMSAAMHRWEDRADSLFTDCMADTQHVGGYDWPGARALLDTRAGR